MRILALDPGEARCGCAISDPTGTLATPLSALERPSSRKGLARLRSLARELGAEKVVIGLPLTLRGEEGVQARRARDFAERLGEGLDIPVELHDERFTTRMAEASGGQADADSRAAAHLLEGHLAALGNAGGAEREPGPA